MIDPLITYRQANIGDAQLYYQWANDPLVRQYSFNQQNILFEDHLKWFEEKVKAQDHVLLLFFYQERPFGQMRFLLDRNTAVINYSIADEYRGKKLSSPLIDNSIDFLQKNHPEIKVIIARVKNDNPASISVFRNNHFHIKQQNEEETIFERLV